MKIRLSTQIQLVAWSIYWLLLLFINVMYFKREDYPQLLVILWTILYTVSGVGIFYLVSKVYSRLLKNKTDIIKILTLSIPLSFISAYFWKLLEPTISWFINPNIKSLEIVWDINANGTFAVTFIVAFFSVLFIFSKNMEEAKSQKEVPDNSVGEGNSLPETVTVYHKNEIVLLPVANIKKISVDGNYSIIIDNRNKKYELKKALKKWETELPAASFKRIHRSTLVNTAFIEKIELWHNYTYRIKLEGVEEPEEVSRRYAAILKKTMNL